MNKSQRIKLDINTVDLDKHIKIKLEQDIDTIEFLSMNIVAKDVYQDFNADYGVLVGRVIANGGIGIPNAKISIFIPLTDDDAERGEVYSIYPYKTPRDKNTEGKRYNLLPRAGKINPDTGVSSPKQPFGSFPIKEEIITNEPYLNVYKKYYKYTTLTNNSGDYMIFGVPIGTQTVHLSVDITDIGKYSMTPAAMVTNLGYSANLFTDNNSKIKPSNDLNDLPHIETQEISVDIIPFWGDATNFEIGITRQDFRIRSTLQNTFIIFGSSFTDGDNAMWGDESVSGTRRIEEMYNARSDAHVTVGMGFKRIGKVSEKIFYYPANITDDDIDDGNVADDGSDMLLLDPAEYSVYKRDGDFVFIISCNRNKVVTDELGNEISVDNNSTSGVFTKFRGFLTLEISSEALPMTFTGSIGSNTTITPFRYRMKFPQHAPRDESFSKPGTSHAGVDDAYNIRWRKQSYSFDGGKFYSLATFHGLTFNNDHTDPSQFGLNNGFFQGDEINKAYKKYAFNNVGLVLTGSYGEIDPDTGLVPYDNSIAEFPSNSITDVRVSLSEIYLNVPCFGANWLNLTVYLPQVGYLSNGYSHIRSVRSADHFTKQLENNSGFNSYFYGTNTQMIAAGVFNTQFMPRSDLNWTDIIQVEDVDIKEMSKFTVKGFKNDDAMGYTWKGKYRNGTIVPTTGDWTEACPINGGKDQGNPVNSPDNKIYFYKGYDAADCIQYLFDLGLIN